MLPWIHLATATAPGGDMLRLLSRGDAAEAVAAWANTLPSPHSKSTESCSVA